MLFLSDIWNDRMTYCWKHVFNFSLKFSDNGVTKEDQVGAVDQLNEALYVHQVEEEVMAAEVIAPNQESHQEDL